MPRPAATWTLGTPICSTSTWGALRRFDARDLWEQACTYARAHSQPDKQQGRACCIYRDIAGAWPPRGRHIDNTPDVQISRAVLNKIKAANIAFAKRREREAA